MISPEYRRRRGAPRPLLMLLVVAVLLSTLYFFGAPLTSIVHRFFSPLFTTEASSLTWFSRIALHWRTESDLIAENVALKEELSDSRLLVLDRNLLYEENIALKERMGRFADPDVVVATVVLRPPQSPYDTLLLDVGSVEGVARGDLVSAAGSLLIGSVREVYAHSSRVVLFSSPGEVHQGFLDLGERGGNEPVTIEGLGSGALRGRVPRGALVLEGDSVTIPSITPNIAARVARVESDDTESFQTVYLHLPANYFELRQVDVWRNSPPTP